MIVVGKRNNFTVRIDKKDRLIYVGILAVNDAFTARDIVFRAMKKAPFEAQKTWESFEGSHTGWAYKLPRFRPEKKVLLAIEESIAKSGL